MNSDDRNNNLERLIHERLRALPDRPAPRELIPGVMSRIAARQARHWWQCPWPAWPRGMQVLSVLMFAGLIGTVLEFRLEILASAAQLGGRATANLPLLRAIWTIPAAFLDVLQILLGSLKSHLLVISALVISGLYFSAVGVGALLYRVAADKN